MTDESTATPDLDDLLNDDFNMGDDGEIQMPETKAEVETPETESTPEVTPDPEPTHDFEKRYNDLLPEFTRRSQDLAELNKHTIPALQAQIDQLREGNSRPTENTDDRVKVPEDLAAAMQNPEEGAQLIMDLASKVVEQQLGEFVTRVAPMLDDYEIEQELKDVALTKGNEDFFELLPSIRKIIAESESDLTFADALGIARTFKNVPETTSDDGDDAAGKAADTTAPKVSAEEIAEQAARHQPETSVAGEVEDPPPKVDSVEDAVNDAFATVYG